MHGATALPLLAARCVSAQPTVTLDGVGTLSGATAGGVDSFLGIPYAEPPVGDAGRFRPPAPKGAWNGTRSATEFGAACLGGVVGVGNVGCYTVKKPASEDCLFLNVFSPSDRAPDAALPVMFWIHGGAYALGCSQQNNGGSLCATSGGKVVVVTINYRLAAFGFLGSSLLASRDPGGSTGNYGLQDQRLAMQWVQQHIAAFGGDPKNVLIFGESAGAGSVAAHLTAPRSYGLYHKVIGESGVGADWNTNSMERAEKMFATMMKNVKCAPQDVACLVALPAQKIKSASIGGPAWEASIPFLYPSTPDGQALGFAPTIDGVEFTAPTYAQFRDGKVNSKVPVLLGSNRDEMAIFFGLSKLVVNNKLEYSAFTRTFGNYSDAVKQLYDPDGAYPYPADLGQYSKWWWAAQRASSDGAMSCPARNAARGLEKAGAPAVYLYLFAHAGAKGTVSHATELPYVFNCPISITNTSTGPYNPADCVWGDANDAALATAMSAYWLRFAETGDPNAQGENGQPNWPKYTAAGDESLRIDSAPAGITAEAGLRRDACHPRPRVDCTRGRQIPLSTSHGE